MKFSTWRALGNTYRVVERDEVALDASRASELAAGTDGVLEVVSESPGEVEIVIWNPDGSQAELSGNGTRIAAAWLASRTGVPEVDVVTAGRVTHARLLAGGDIEQDLGEVSVGVAETVDGVTFTPVSVGNPHAVVIGDPDDVLHVGPLLETHPRFPQRTNVQVARVNGPGDVTARVWERGVGETLSSGTSAVAVAAATHGAGDVVVHFPGGDLRVRLESGRATLIGPAERLRVPRQVLVYVFRAKGEGEREVLLLRRLEGLGGFWQGVTGAPEWGEEDEDGAAREVLEETGLDVSGRLRSIGYRYDLHSSGSESSDWDALYGPGVECVPEEVYAAEAPLGWEPTLQPREHDAYRWCAVGDALGLLAYEENRTALRIAARVVAGACEP